MPKSGDYGYSEETAAKNADLRGLLMMHTQICKNRVSQRCPYQYMDLNAGPGIYTPRAAQADLWGNAEQPAPAEIHGSPLIFLDCAQTRRIPYRAVLFEKDNRHRASLTAALSAHPSVTIEGDHDDAPRHMCNCPRCGRLAQGIIYSDESGHIPPFQLLATLASQPHYKQVDLLIYYSATAHKRARGLFGGDRLTQCLKPIPKKEWLVREPRGRHQWTFLLGTNWEDFPAWGKRGFYRIGSERGQRVLKRLDSSADELREAETSVCTALSFLL